MATVLKCKMCGGDISVNADMTVGTCQYCGSTMTLPRIDTEKKARLFNHANQYRLNCEFDKAFEAYKMISQEDESEPEAYWGMLLSEYGVEYVEDPKTKKRIPTCHRTIVKPVKSNTHYELAYKYADTEGKLLYQDEAEVIEDLQRKIVSISAKEDPYDIFICYKETDEENGERTIESVAAQEIYDELTKNGFKVFFSRITLADKLGKDFEPYIYSALRSAKIMLVVCSSASNANSIWVKNEWSRFVQFIAEDNQKTLIPVYKDMDATALPSELSRFQGQDLNKVGAIQDLVVSIKRIITAGKRIESDEALNTLIEKQLQKERKQKEREIRRASARQKLPGILKKLAIAIGIIAMIAGIAVATRPLVNRIKTNKALEDSYQLAASYAEEDNFKQAYNAITDADFFKNRDEALYNYVEAGYAYETNDYSKANSLFMQLQGYKNSDYFLLLSEYKLLAKSTASNTDEALNRLDELAALGIDDSDNVRELLISREIDYLFANKDYQEMVSKIQEYEKDYPSLIENLKEIKESEWKQESLNEIAENWQDGLSITAPALSILYICDGEMAGAIEKTLKKELSAKEIFDFRKDFGLNRDFLSIMNMALWDCYPEWLNGRWTTPGGTYFTYNYNVDTGSEQIDHNIPTQYVTPSFSNKHLDSNDGTVYAFSDKSSWPTKNKVALFEIRIDSYDAIQVSSTKTRGYLTLYRR